MRYRAGDPNRRARSKRRSEKGWVPTRVRLCIGEDISIGLLEDSPLPKTILRRSALRCARLRPAAVFPFVILLTGSWLVPPGEREIIFLCFEPRVALVPPLP
jgi:hypothetical protein